MRNTLKKYYKMNDESKMLLEDLYLIHIIENKIKENENLNLNIAEEEVIFESVKNISKASNIKVEELVRRIFEILQGADMTIEDIVELDEEKISDLITEDEEDYKSEKYEILKEFIYGGFYCVFIREGTRYILIFDKNDNSHVEIFENIEELLCYVIKNKLLSEGESIV
ncbi:MAG: hypothetical protein J6I85_06360 [Clostridia bacterium]|nr:hypothetical protein [Clostridia bacterium]